MAPTSTEGFLAKRQYCYDGFGNSYYCGNSSWNSWGRWVALAVIVVCLLLIAFMFSCYNSRRRRRRGMAPMYGTGWMPGVANYKPPAGQQYGGYYPNDPYNGTAAPPYSPPIPNQQTGNTFNSNEGYYGNHYNEQQSGIELQQPQSTYQPQRGGDAVYSTPDGPPPRKGDGIIR